MKSAPKAANSGAAVSNSAFKTLLMNFLAVGGDSLKLDKKYKKSIRCAVREIEPQLLLTDGQYTLSGYITKEAFALYCKNPENKVKVTELRDYMITIDSWTLDLVKVTPDESFTSYSNLEMRLIINKFSKFSETRVDLNNRYPQNLYRDDQVGFCINKFLLSCQRQMLEGRLSGAEGKKALERNVVAQDAHLSR